MGKILDRMKHRLAHRFSAAFFNDPDFANHRLSIQEAEAGIELYPAMGFWRQTKADVMQFQGVINIRGRTFSIGSWESMTDCLRHGFDFHDCRNKDWAEAHFMCVALARTNERDPRV